MQLNRSRRTRHLAPRILALACAAAAQTALGAESNWQVPTGGSWIDPLNWSLGVPDGTTDALFNQNSTYTATLAGDAAVHTVTVRQDTLTLDLAASTLSLNGDFLVADSTVDAHVIIRNGLINQVSGQSLNIGKTWNGSLRLEAGGKLTTASSATVGGDPAALGSLQIDGAGSVFTYSGTTVFNFGSAGPAELSITASGTLVHTGASALVIGQNFGATASVNNGTISVPNEAIFVGRNAVGTMTVTNGSTITSLNAYIGHDTSNSPGGNGLVMVDGVGTSWTIANTLQVGGSGTGTLSVTGGGTVTAGTIAASSRINWNGGTISTGRIGAGALGTPGNIVFSGQGQFRDNALYIGGDSNNPGADGTMTMTGGSVDSSMLLIWNQGTTHVDFSGGTLTTHTLDTNGNPSRFNWTGGHFKLLGQDLTVQPNGPLGAAVSVGAGKELTAHLIVGSEGTGTLAVTAGGKVNFGPDSLVGFIDGSQGTLTVDGVGTQFSPSAPGGLFVGWGGNGTFNVQNGATATSGNFTTAVTGTGVATVIVLGAGSSFSSADTDIALNGTTSLNILSGGAMHVSGDLRLGINSNAAGTLVVDGANSTFDVQGYIVSGLNGTASMTVRAGGVLTATHREVWIGEHGNATLNVESGGHMNSAVGVIARSDGSSSTVNVGGAGSVWANSGGLFVGGQQSIAGGVGVVNVGTDGTISVGAGMTVWGTSGTAVNVNGGTLVIAGDSNVFTGAKVAISGGTATTARLFSDGALTLSNGGHLTNGRALIAQDVGHTSTVTVGDAGSTWSSSVLYVGGSDSQARGKGILNVNPGGQVNVSDIFWVWGMAGTAVNVNGGTVTVAGDSSVITGGVINVAGGTFNSNQLFSNGNVIVTGGGHVNTNLAMLAPDTDGIANVMLSGVGTTWNNTTLAVGGHDFLAGGDSVVTVNPGATINDSVSLVVWGNLGTALNLAGGTVNVAGDSTVAAGGQLNVAGGTYTSGRLLNSGAFTVSSGGQATTGVGMVSAAFGGMGTVVVGDQGSLWSSTALYVGGNDIGPRATGVLQIDPGGTVTDSGLLKVWGTTGSGVNINGGILSVTGDTTVSAGGQITASAGSFTTARILNDGVVSIWSGMHVSSAVAMINPTPGTTGSITIGDSGSLWNSTGLYIGGSDTGAGGHGTFNINAGATVNVAGPLTVWGSSGTALTMNGGVLGVTGDTTIATAGHINVSGATMTSGRMLANGALTISGQGHVTNGVAMVSPDAGGLGTVSVGDSGSTWTSSALYVGGSDTAVGGKGIVSAGSGTTITVGGPLKVWGSSGTLMDIGGATLAVAGDTSIASGGKIALTSASGFTTARLFNGGGLLSIADGSHVTNALATVGADPAGGASVALTGAGSTWTSGPLFVGGSDTAIGGGGSVSAGAGTAINVAGNLTLWGSSGSAVNVSSATLAVTGDASIATNAQINVSAATMTAGRMLNNGQIAITNGAQVTNGVAMVGPDLNSVAGVSIGSPGSTWSSTSLYVGGNSTGAGGSGVVTVGTGATLNASGSLTVWGSSGTTLTVAGGTLAVTGSATVASGGHLALFNGSLSAASLQNDGTYAQSGGTATVNAMGNSAANLGDTTISVGTLNVTSFRQNSLTLGPGRLLLSPTVVSSPVVLNTLSISNDGRIDLSNHSMIVRQTPVGTWSGTSYDGISGYIASGRNGGAWNATTGILTSQTDATTSSLTSLGVARAADVLGIAATATSIWAGESVTGSDTLVMYTYGGDANLDGKINVDDYTRIDFNVGINTTGWYNGDFNYDGRINVDDYTIIDFNVGIQGGAFSPGAPAESLAGAALISTGVSAVPEPTAIGVVALSACFGALKRQRRSSKRVGLLSSGRKFTNIS